jgi:DHA2 family multidrug resistance protein-like MFS transporter
MGGALGVAVLGSVFATIYRPGVADKLAGAGLSGEQLTRAQDSIGGALQVASELPDRALAANVIATAKQQFVDGMHLAIVVAIAVVLLASLIVFLFLPARAHDHVADRSDADADAVIRRPLADAAS